ncbi:hypothetical protein [Halalkalicoccus salilacus]
MAANPTPVGIDHPTVVPVNAEECADRGSEHGETESETALR